MSTIKLRGFNSIAVKTDNNEALYYVIGFSGSTVMSCSSSEGKPLVFTLSEAREDIADLLEDFAEANMDNDLEWKAIPVSDYKRWELINMCGLS